MIQHTKRYQNIGLNNSLEPLNCASYLSNVSSKSDLEFSFHRPANLAQAKLVERVPWDPVYLASTVYEFLGTLNNIVKLVLRWPGGPEGPQYITCSIM